MEEKNLGMESVKVLGKSEVPVIASYMTYTHDSYPDQEFESLSLSTKDFGIWKMLTKRIHGQKEGFEIVGDINSCVAHIKSVVPPKAEDKEQLNTIQFVMVAMYETKPDNERVSYISV